MLYKLENHSVIQLKIYPRDFPLEKFKVYTNLIYGFSAWTGNLIKLKTCNFRFLIFVQKYLICKTMKISCKNPYHYWTLKIVLLCLLKSHIGRSNTYQSQDNFLWQFKFIAGPVTWVTNGIYISCMYSIKTVLVKSMKPSWH